MSFTKILLLKLCSSDYTDTQTFTITATLYLHSFKPSAAIKRFNQLLEMCGVLENVVVILTYFLMLKIGGLQPVILKLYWESSFPRFTRYGFQEVLLLFNKYYYCYYCNHNNEQGRQRTYSYNVTLWRVRATIVTVERQRVLHILSVCL
jgi:hypothetical protein